MTNLINERELASSLECPIVDGQRQVQHVTPHSAEVGGIPVNRALPRRQRRMIGAWCFLDHIGPADFAADDPGLRVGPHPHIGLQTFTWMIEGEIFHRDSLGTAQVIRPGQVNLMTAGRGISHTEESLSGDPTLHAAQLWIALPEADCGTDPRFDHYPNLPRWQQEGTELTLLVGDFAGHSAPALTFSPLVALDLASPRGGHLRLSLREGFEYGLVALQGDLEVDGDTFATHELAYLGRGRDEATVTLPPGGRVLLVGGEPLGEEILIWWNFVGHSKAEISQAQHDWEAESPRFGSIPEFDGPRLTAPPLPWAAGSS